MEVNIVKSTEIKKDRIVYFDFLKVISIFLVVFVHYAWIGESRIDNLFMILAVVAVPLFFMVNGALMLNKKLDIKKHFKKIFWILIGIFSWKILIFNICLLVGRINISDLKIIDVISYLVTSSNLDLVPAEHLWFMYALIKVYIIFPFLKLVMDRDEKYLKYILIFIMMFSFGIELFNTVSVYMNIKWGIPQFNFYLIQGTFSPLSYNMEFLSFFILGYMLYKKIYKVEYKHKKTKFLVDILVLLLGMGLLLTVKFLQTGTVLKGQYIPINNYYLKCGTLLIAIAIFSFCSKINFKSNKFIDFIGNRTINIYYIHMIIVAFLNTYLLPKLNITGGFIVNVLRTAVVVLVCIFVTEILKRIKILKKSIKFKLNKM